MKHEWRKQEKQIYIPKQIPTLISVPNFKFISITGQGDPNSSAFGDRIKALYQVSYAIRMMPKKGIVPEGYFEYTVYPLEGTWDLTEKGRELEVLDKNELIYKIMIRQPEFVTDEVFNIGLELSKHKEPSDLLDELKFEFIEEGLSLQMMHIGSFDDETHTFAIMNQYIEENNLKLVTKVHREIYLSDFRKVEESKRQTVLRYQVKHKS